MCMQLYNGVMLRTYTKQEAIAKVKQIIRDQNYYKDTLKLLEWLEQGKEMETLTIPQTPIGVQFTTDPDYPDKVEIAMVDSQGAI